METVHMEIARREHVDEITAALKTKPAGFAIRNAKLIDANGVREHTWIVVDHGVISAVGSNDPDFARACEQVGIAYESTDVVDAQGQILTPGYIDTHAHGGWGMSFDDGLQGIETSRAAHAFHGTTRAVVSLITNPIDTICQNLTVLHKAMTDRPDILGVHLEGPFLAPTRRGAHDPACLRDPRPELVARVLEAGQGAIRQITIAPELPHGLDAIRSFAEAGVVPAVGHCEADYEMARKAFDAGAGILTHIFNAMNGLKHRAPGPVAAAIEDTRVSVELINDGFHVQDPMVKIAFQLAPHRIELVTDAMSATGCPDGQYLLGTLAVNVVGGHARLVEGGAIAGSTLLLEKAVSRAVLELGMDPVQAIEATTLTPAKTYGLNRPNAITGAPLGLVAPGYAADLLLLDATQWSVQRVWCNGRSLR